MVKFELGQWANQQAWMNGWLIFITATVTIWMYPFWFVGPYTAALGAFTLIVELPRSKRKRGQTPKRMFHDKFAPLVESMGGFGANYAARAVFYIMAALPLCIEIPTTLNAIGYFILAFIYFQAHRRGEQYVSTAAPTDTQKIGRSAAPKISAPIGSDKPVMTDEEGNNIGMKPNPLVPTFAVV
eukprot:Clim_evm126s210 gene=Clim_evmTU126s210